MTENTVQKDVEHKAWILALGSDSSAPGNLYTGIDMREMREYIANNWSFVPQELKEAWGSEDKVKSGAPLRLTDEQLTKAESASRKYFNATVDKTRENRKEEAKKQAAVQKENEKKTADQKAVAREQAEAKSVKAK